MQQKPVSRLINRLLSVFLLVSLLVSGMNINNVSIAHAHTITADIRPLTVDSRVRHEPTLEPADILFNGSFEEGDSAPLGWSEDAWDMSHSTFLWDTTQHHSGNRSLKISNDPENDARWIQTIYVQQNSNYRFSGWIKTENAGQGDGRGANLSTFAPLFTGTSAVTGTNDWTYVSYELNTGSNDQITVAARIGYYSSMTTGTAWFDDLHLELLDTPVCYSLVMNVSPLGTGKILTDPSPNCNNGTQYVRGTTIKFTAAPNPNYIFSSWNGDLNGSQSPQYLLMTANKSISASFSSSTAILTVTKDGTGNGTVQSSPDGIACGIDCSQEYSAGTQVVLTASPVTGSVFAGWNGSGCSGTGTCTVTIGQPVEVNATFILGSQHLRWKILVLIYTSTDFTYSDDTGQHHVIATMTSEEISRAIAASNKFVTTDVPLLTSGNMLPVLTIRTPNHALSNLDPYCGYWPSRSSISADLDPAFDSVIVIWDESGVDQNTGQPANLNCYGGLTPSNGTGQTYSTFIIDMVPSNQRNVFKHEWGHSILAYFEAEGLSPLPTVDNHINDTTTKYVHCSSGTPYILQDETDDNLIPNSIYNNNQGFTHDYYSGTTAKPASPNKCLGIIPSAWATGGPVTKPIAISIPGIPSLLSPISGSIVETLQPTLDWKDSIPHADHYQIQVATSSTFTAQTLVIDEPNIPTSDLTPAFDLTPGRLYYWQVRAFNVA